VKPGAKNRQVQEQLLDISLDHHLDQVNPHPTRGANILDLFFTNNSTLINRVEVIPGVSDHDIVFIDTKVVPCRIKKSPHKIRQYGKANYENMKQDIENLGPKISSIDRTDVESMWSTFRDGFKQSMERNIPTKLSSTRYDRPWINRDIKRNVRQKQRAYNRARSSGKAEDWSRFRTIRKATQEKIRKAYWNHINNIISDPGESDNHTSQYTKVSKRFWAYIKGLNRDQQGVQPLLHD
jgi:hypothetical protein